MAPMATQRAFTVQATAGRRRREATQQQIIDALHRLLEAGAAMAALSVERIAAEAGVSRSTFYLHFPDKRDLIARLAEQELSEWRQISTAVLTDPRAPRAVVEQTVRDTLAAWRRHAPVVSGLIELSEYDADARDAWRAAVDAIADTLAGHLRERWAGRDLPPGDPDTIARIVVWMTERVCHQMLRDPDPDTEERVAAALTESIWRIAEPRRPGARG